MILNSFLMEHTHDINASIVQQILGSINDKGRAESYPQIFLVFKSKIIKLLPQIWFPSQFPEGEKPIMR